MTEIRDAGSMQYANSQMPKAQPKKVSEDTPQVPQDQVQIGQPKESLAKKIIHFPAKVLGTVGGAVVGVANAPLHILPGAVKGIQEGLTSEKGEGTHGLFHFAMWTQNLALGAGAGFMMGGPMGAAIGGVGAAIFTGVSSFVGERSDAYDGMIKDVEANVDKAVEDNTGNKTKVMVQNAVEGSIIGGGAAFKSGGKVGYQAGKGIVEGVMGGFEGVVEGLYEAGKSIITGK